MTLPELFRRLRPLFRQRIDALWIEYQFADPQQKQEIEELITMLAIKHLGMMIGDARLILDAPPPGLIGRGEILLGHVTYPGLTPYPFRVSKNELLRHVFILGPTGTGKSTLIIGLLTQLNRARIPFMVFDFKRNYRCLTKGGVKITTVGRNIAPLRLNVLREPPNVTFAEWSAALADAISSSYLLLHGARNVLSHAMQDARRTYGERATLQHVLTSIREQLFRSRVSSRRYGWLESAARSIEELTTGELGAALNSTDGSRAADHLSLAIVFELHGLGEDQKRFFCLYWLHHLLLLRKSSSEERETLHHVMVMDEAHNVFPTDQPGTPSVSARVAREIREYGEAIISATQQTDINQSIIANSGIKIILRCDYPRDMTFASQLLQIDTKWIPTLTTGTAIARLPERYLQPFQFTFPPQPLKNTRITDEQIARRTTPVQTALSARETQLLVDISTHPSSTTTQRYERLRWHPKIGNDIRERVRRKDLITAETLSTGRAQAKILTLTAAGRHVLAAQGITVSRSRGGPTHEYWRNATRELLEQHGYTITTEHQLPSGGYADILATKNDLRVYIEIETGKSDVERNTAKYQPSDHVIMLFTDPTTHNTKHNLPPHIGTLHAMRLRELPTLLESLTVPPTPIPRTQLARRVIHSFQKRDRRNKG